MDEHMRCYTYMVFGFTDRNLLEIYCIGGPWTWESRACATKRPTDGYPAPSMINRSQLLSTLGICPPSRPFNLRFVSHGIAVLDSDYQNVAPLYRHRHRGDD